RQPCVSSVARLTAIHACETTRSCPRDPRRENPEQQVTPPPLEPAGLPAGEAPALFLTPAPRIRPPRVHSEPAGRNSAPQVIGTSGRRAITSTRPACVDRHCN